MSDHDDRPADDEPHAHDVQHDKSKQVSRQPFPHPVLGSIFEDAARLRKIVQERVDERPTIDRIGRFLRDDEMPSTDQVFRLRHLGRPVGNPRLYTNELDEIVPPVQFRYTTVPNDNAAQAAALSPINARWRAQREAWIKDVEQESDELARMDRALRILLDHYTCKLTPFGDDLADNDEDADRIFNAGQLSVQECLRLVQAALGIEYHDPSKQQTNDE